MNQAPFLFHPFIIELTNHASSPPPPPPPPQVYVFKLCMCMYVCMCGKPDMFVCTILYSYETRHMEALCSLVEYNRRLSRIDPENKQTTT